ncbi:hypothetical protein [Rhodanobacter sp. BL-MT-08]
MRTNFPTDIGAVRLRAKMRQEVLTDPRDSVVSRIGEHDFSTMFGIIPDTLAVLRSASAFEKDKTKLLEWFSHERIASLGGLSAASLVRMGRAALVLDFLKRVEVAERFGGFVCEDQGLDDELARS